MKLTVFFMGFPEKLTVAQLIKRLDISKNPNLRQHFQKNR
jgi:hypothetical protein